MHKDSNVKKICMTPSNYDGFTQINAKLTDKIRKQVKAIDNLTKELDKSKAELVDYKKDWLKEKLDFCCPIGYQAYLGVKQCEDGQEQVPMIDVQDHECCSRLESSCDPGPYFENATQLCCGLHQLDFICCPS